MFQEIIISFQNVVYNKKLMESHVKYDYQVLPPFQVAPGKCHSLEEPVVHIDSNQVHLHRQLTSLENSFTI